MIQERPGSHSQRRRKTVASLSEAAHEDSRGQLNAALASSLRSRNDDVRKVHEVPTCQSCGLSDSDLLRVVRRRVGGEREATARLSQLWANSMIAGISRSRAVVALYLLHPAPAPVRARGVRTDRGARAARKWPIVLELLADGSLHLTGVALLSRHLTTENHREFSPRRGTGPSARSKKWSRRCGRSHRSRPPSRSYRSGDLPRPQSPCWSLSILGLPSLSVPRRAPSHPSRRLHHQGVLPKSRHLRRSTTRCSSPPRARPTTSSGRLRICCGTVFRTATSPPSSIVR